MDSARFTFLFHRYINATCSEEEKEEFMTLLSASNHDVQLKSIMKDMWTSGSADRDLSPDQREKMLQDIFNSDDSNVNISRQTSGKTWMRVAAAIIVFSISLGAAYYYLQRGNENLQLAAKKDIRSAEHQIIKLPDGTVVKLNTGSSLEYPESFDGKISREVILTGEGYFDVQHDPARAFIVRTGKLNTTVLGTAFNIKAYTAEKNITVTVTRGKVKVSDDKNVLGIITPNQQIVFHKESQEASQQTVDSRASIAWSDNDILFDDVTIEEAVKQLEERFHVTINLRNEKIKACRFTATFIRGEDLNQMLTVICEFNGARFKNNGEGVIEISGEGC